MNPWAALIGATPVPDTDYVIEKNVPIPPKPGYRLGQARAALRMLEVGDSFLITDEKQARTVQSHFHEEKPKRFTSRREAGGVRVWRLE